jgi:hypothetical protein
MKALTRLQGGYRGGIADFGARSLADLPVLLAMDRINKGQCARGNLASAPCVI